MKVVLLVGRLSEHSGGLAASVPAMAKALSDTEVEVHIVGVVDPSDPGAAQNWGRFVHPHTAFGPASFHWSPSMAQTLDRLDPNVIDTQGLWMNLSRVALARQRTRGQTYVVTPRGMIDPWALRRSAWRKRLAARLFENEHLARAQVVRALNEDEARAVRSYGVQTPIAIVPNGIMAPDRTLLVEKRSPVIQFLGRLHPKKGVEPLLQAWALVRSRIVRRQLAVAGERLGQLGLCPKAYSPCLRAILRDTFLWADLYSAGQKTQH